MKLIRVSWEDLLAVPFAEMDCWAMAAEIGRRIGKPLPEGADADCFDRVGLPYEVGDILASDPEKKGHISHVATVVDIEGRGRALSTSVSAGPYCWPIHRVHHECGVWRVRLTVGTGT